MIAGSSLTRCTVLCPEQVTLSSALETSAGETSRETKKMDDWEIKLQHKQIKITTTNFGLTVNNIKLAIDYCHPGARQTTQKLVHFYMLIN